MGNGHRLNRRSACRVKQVTPFAVPAELCVSLARPRPVAPVVPRCGVVVRWVTEVTRLRRIDAVLLAGVLLLLLGVAAYLPAGHGATDLSAVRSEQPIARPAPWPAWAHSTRPFAMARTDTPSSPPAMSPPSTTTGQDTHDVTEPGDAAAVRPLRAPWRAFYLGGSQHMLCGAVVRIIPPPPRAA